MSYNTITTRTKKEYTVFFTRWKQTIKLLTKNNLDSITETQDLIMGNRAFYKNFYSSQQTEPSKYQNSNAHTKQPQFL